MRSVPALALLAAVAFTGCDAFSSGPGSMAPVAAPSPTAVSASAVVDSVDLYVEFVEGVISPEAASDEAFEGQDVRRRPYVRDENPGVGITVALADYDALMAVLALSPLVSSVEIDIAFAVPGEGVDYVPLSDQYTGQPWDAPVGAFTGQMMPWNVSMIGGDTSSAASGDGSGAVDIDVYVIDSGVDHADLNVVESVRFFDAADPGSSDHGTHVAGIIAGIDDGDGLVGVAPGARIHSFDVFDGEGTTPMSRLVAAVVEITARKKADPSRPIVVNMSVGANTGTTQYNALDRAVRRSIRAGVVYVISAGNQGIDASVVSPAHVTQAITVGAHDANGAFAADFSNRGSMVDILAPGVRVVSTAGGDRYARMDGTSMAAPHVAGAAALALAHQPNLNQAKVARLLARHAQGGILTDPTTTNLAVNVSRL